MAFYKVEPRAKANGEPRYKCTVRVKSKGKIVYSATRTFGKNAAAEAWGKKRVAELELNGVPTQGTQTILLRDFVATVVDDPHIELKRTKLYVLQMLADCEIGALPIDKITSADVVKHCKMRREAGAGPATVAHDVSYLRWCLKTARVMLSLDITDAAVVDSYEVLYNQNLIGKSERRHRRPTSDEIEKLKEGLLARSSHRASIGIPYVDILDFSILSCMRIGEVCRIKWEDVDEAQRAVLVMDRKDPRKKSGNHMLVPLLGGAWEILQRQPKEDDRIFPYNEKSVTAGFQRVRNALGISDLRYHDLRREGASRLFEKGYSIDEVAQVTGHRNINTLWQVYTELFPKRLHDKEFVK